MDKLAAAKDTEIATLHTQVQACRRRCRQRPPKRIIVDDTEKPKKPVKKKSAKPAIVPIVPKPAAPKPAAPTTPKPQ